MNCERMIRENAKFHDIKYMWEIMDADETFEFPDYHGERMTILDCHISKGKRNVQDAVRSLMEKMNIEIVELEKNRDEAYNCASREIVGYHRDEPMSQIELEEYFADRYKNVETDCVVSYCKYCNDGIKLSGRKGKHLLELLFP